MTMLFFNIIFSAIKYLSYSSDWKRVLFVITNGGYNVYHKQHKFSNTNGGGFAEQQIGKILAIKYAQQVEFLPEDSTSGGKADMSFNHQKWEVKNISASNSCDTIRKAISDASKAENVIFWWNSKVNKLGLLKEALKREVGRSKKNSKTIPNVYFTNIDDNIVPLYIKEFGAASNEVTPT